VGFIDRVLAGFRSVYAKKSSGKYAPLIPTVTSARHLHTPEEWKAELT